MLRCRAPLARLRAIFSRNHPQLPIAFTPNFPANNSPVPSPFIANSARAFIGRPDYFVFARFFSDAPPSSNAPPMRDGSGGQGEGDGEGESKLKQHHQQQHQQQQQQQDPTDAPRMVHWRENLAALRQERSKSQSFGGGGGGGGGGGFGGGRREASRVSCFNCGESGHRCAARFVRALFCF